MGQVFISYSHKDGEALEQLRRFLVPLERAGRLTCWDDTRIATGDDWKQRIDDALGQAGAAVLLISQDFLASRFISEEELPYLLSKRADGLATLLPVFIAPSNVGSAQPELAKIQGHGNPGTDKVLTRDEREILFKKLSDRLLELAEANPAPPSPRPPKPAIPATFPAPSSSGYELTVTLRRDGADLAAAYRLPGREPFLTTRRPFHAVAETFAQMRRTLDSGDAEAVRDHIRTAPGHWGRVLFEVLFGTDARHQETIFRTAFHQPPAVAAPTALRAPLRLRIVAEVLDLLGLPWRLTSWSDRLLAKEGWVFLPSLAEDPSRDLVTAAPSEVLLVAPRDPGSAPAVAASHLDVLEQTLRAVWQSRELSVRRAHDTAQLQNALAGQRPHLVYVIAPVEPQRGRLCLLLDHPSGKGQEALALDDLAGQFRESLQPPAVLYLNCQGTGMADPTQVFGAELPLLIWRHLPARGEDALDVAVAWLGAWLREGIDPVEALHRAGSSERFAVSPEAQTLGVLANFRHWRTDQLAAGGVRERLAHLRLDREKQKGVVGKWVAELAGSDALRVMALVPFATPGNRLADVQEQFCHYLELALQDRVAIKPIRLEFPKSRGNLRKDLEWELSLQLQADDGEPVRDLLQRQSPRVIGNHRPVLWLHWGIFGSGAACQPGLTADQLRDWLTFAGTFLPQHCPANVRIVCSLAIETEADKHPAVAQLLHAKHRELDDPKFWLRILDPIGNVAENELFDYFKDDKSGCPPPIRSDLAQLLIAKTNGAFEPLVALIQQAETTSFHDLLAILRREQGQATAETIETF
jgi:hypothetical protein